MRILVLGSTGYLGAHVAARLRARPGVRLFTGGREAGAPVRADLAADSPARLAQSIGAVAPDAVVNCAGAVGGDPAVLHAVNARGPGALCDALRQAAPRARLVHLGSAAEYGPGEPGTLAAEPDPARPASAYGESKWAGTVAVGRSALDAVVLRVGNPVGPGAPDAGLPGRLAALLRAAGSDPGAVIRLGDLSAYRDFVDVRDVAAAAEAAATAPGPLPPVLNVGGGGAVPVRELVHRLARIAGFRGRIEEDGGASARSGEVSWQCSDISAAREALGWRPVHGLEDSLAALWAAAGLRDPVGGRP
ncbi:NAD(P)-dependent oxidoreductase [Streptomyces sp. NPDC047000]|uniref:NAD-dependent epimerase/dehydratase family protein n=1 Tax=Streptomyces sp. NPDC047000 TaxID=3155474 RepID=UPI0033C2273C